MITGPKDIADRAYKKWSQPLDNECEGIVEEMQADMMVLVGLVYGLCLPDEISLAPTQPDESK